MVTTVDMKRGFETITLRIDEEHEMFVVSGVSIYWTHQGGRVGGTFERKFNNRESARHYANGWFKSLVDKGWKRVA
jgi:hypothetical protein